ncbi:TetR/AcrR family transcriptional regulator [Antrihabitans stalactiti]|nr:TetR/AcrR family transcriptional regulator [Antrihabitans stalactiti]
MPNVVRPFKGVSAEDRVTQRRADLIDAALDLVGSGGIGNLTMTAVCEGAGLTQRYFYEHFRNRDELVVALFDTVFDEFFGRVQDAVEAAPPDLSARAHATMEVFVDFFASDPRKARVFAEATTADVVTAHKTESVHRFAEYAVGQVISTAGPFTEREQTRVLLAVIIIVGGQADAAAQWLRGTIDLPRDEFIDELAELFVTAVDAARKVR